MARIKPVRSVVGSRIPVRGWLLSHCTFVVLFSRYIHLWHKYTGEFIEFSDGILYLLVFFYFFFINRNIYYILLYRYIYNSKYGCIKWTFYNKNVNFFFHALKKSERDCSIECTKWSVRTRNFIDSSLTVIRVLWEKLSKYWWYAMRWNDIF